MAAPASGDTLAEHLSRTDLGEDLSEGGTWVLDLVAAADYLGRGFRCGFTVWDALEEALRWATITDPSSAIEPDWDDPDPLRTALRQLTDAESDAPTARREFGIASVLQAAVRRWVTIMADQYNDGHAWPHPLPRRLFPPPLLTDTTTTEQ